MGRTSAGLLLYRIDASSTVEVLLVHPGGPYWRNKDAGAWSIPKGEVGADEDLLAAAIREFREETGQREPAPANEPARYVPLGSIRQKSGKVVHAWAIEGDCDTATCTSNLMKLEYPPRSGRWIDVPEVDRAAWFTLAEARGRILPAQADLLDALERALASTRTTR